MCVLLLDKLITSLIDGDGVREAVMQKHQKLLECSKLSLNNLAEELKKYIKYINLSKRNPQ